MGFIAAGLILGLACLEGGLRFSNWADKDQVEGFVRIATHRQNSAFQPQLKLKVAGTSFETNAAGERDLQQTSSGSRKTTRIGLFGGPNVLGLWLSEKETLAHYMRIHPPETCELQGRECVFFSYGRLTASPSEIAGLIEHKMDQDSLDIAIWIVDPLMNPGLPSLFRTPSEALNWLLSSFSRPGLFASLQLRSQTQSLVRPQDIEALREKIFQTQKDLIVTVAPSLDVPENQQASWEMETAKTFFQNGFLPFRAKYIIREQTRGSLAIKGTGLMGPELLRALTSSLRQRLDQSPRLRTMKP